MNPPKTNNANGAVAMFSNIQKLVFYLAASAILGTFVGTIANTVMLAVQAEQIENVEDRLEHRDAMIEKLEAKLAHVRISVDHHMASEGHKATTSRINHLERDVDGLKND